MGKGPNNGHALRDAPCTDAQSGRVDGTDASLRSADQLAEPVLSLADGLKQGPRNDTSVRPSGQSGGVGQEDKEKGRRDLGYSTLHSIMCLINSHPFIPDILHRESIFDPHSHNFICTLIKGLGSIFFIFPV